MKVTISSKGQLVIPAEIREQDRIQAGQQFSIERVDSGHYTIKRLELPEKSGLVAWLRECPEDGWFEPLPSESTDSL